VEPALAAAEAHDSEEHALKRRARTASGTGPSPLADAGPELQLDPLAAGHAAAGVCHTDRRYRLVNLDGVTVGALALTRLPWVHDASGSPEAAVPPVSHAVPVAATAGHTNDIERVGVDPLACTVASFHGTGSQLGTQRAGPVGTACAEPDELDEHGRVAGDNDYTDAEEDLATAAAAAASAAAELSVPPPLRGYDQDDHGHVLPPSQLPQAGGGRTSLWLAIEVMELSVLGIQFVDHDTFADHVERVLGPLTALHKDFATSQSLVVVVPAWNEATRDYNHHMALLTGQPSHARYMALTDDGLRKRFETSGLLRVFPFMTPDVKRDVQSRYWFAPSNVPFPFRRLEELNSARYAHSLHFGGTRKLTRDDGTTEHGMFSGRVVCVDPTSQYCHVNALEHILRVACMPLHDQGAPLCQLPANDHVATWLRACFQVRASMAPGDGDGSAGTIPVSGAAALEGSATEEVAESTTIHWPASAMVVGDDAHDAWPVSAALPRRRQQVATTWSRHLFVLRAHGNSSELAGLAVLDVRENHVHVVQVALRPDARGRGHGRILLGEALLRVLRQNVLTLGTANRNGAVARRRTIKAYHVFAMVERFNEQATHFCRNAGAALMAWPEQRLGYDAYQELGYARSAYVCFHRVVTLTDVESFVRDTPRIVQ
jgi:GNAT superfamily N-acetyltransferase